MYRVQGSGVRYVQVAGLRDALCTGFRPVYPKICQPLPPCSTGSALIPRSSLPTYSVAERGATAEEQQQCTVRRLPVWASRGAAAETTAAVHIPYAPALIGMYQGREGSVRTLRRGALSFVHTEGLLCVQVTIVSGEQGARAGGGGAQFRHVPVGKKPWVEEDPLR